MVATAQDLKSAGIGCPMLVGGAALSARFTRMKIAPEYGGLVAYANDAMEGLDLANQLMDEERRAALAQNAGGRNAKAACERGQAGGACADTPAGAHPACARTWRFRCRRI